MGLKVEVFGFQNIEYNTRGMLLAGKAQRTVQLLLSKNGDGITSSYCDKKRKNKLTCPHFLGPPLRIYLEPRFAQGFGNFVETVQKY